MYEPIIALTEAYLAKDFATELGIPNILVQMSTDYEHDQENRQLKPHFSHRNLIVPKVKIEEHTFEIVLHNNHLCMHQMRLIPLKRTTAFVHSLPKTNLVY